MPELWVSFLRPDQMQMQVAQELELFWWKEFVSDPSEQDWELGKEQRDVAGKKHQALAQGRAAAGDPEKGWGCQAAPGDRSKDVSHFPHA